MKNFTFGKILFFSVFTFLSINTSLFSQLYINEFMASNATTIADESGVFDDWIEIYNAGNSAVNIAGYYISDDALNPTIWQIPATNASLTIVPAGGYLILWADKEPTEGPHHVNIKLGSGGEDIVLTNPDGVTTVDTYTFGPQVTDVSEGRTPDGAATWDFFGTPSPNAENSNPGVSNAVAPSSSQAAGFKSGTFSVSLSSPSPNATIYYTLDGSAPDDNDTEYTVPLSVNSTTTLRAVAYEPNIFPSAVKTWSYLYDVSTDFAVVSVVGDPFEIFDPATGMYPNYTIDIEIACNAELFEPNGTLAFSQILETEISGTGSAVYDQKSLSLKAKSSLGSSTMNYPIFPTSNIQAYRSLVLRNSGQDWGIKQFHDAYVSSLVRDLSDITLNIDPPNLDLQEFRPGIAYINGEYWGIHNVREKADKRWIKVHYGLDDTQIDLLDEKNEVKDGDLVAWNELQDFLAANSLTNQSNFDQVDAWVDLDAYVDNIVFNVFIDNSDWPSNNNRRWRERAPNGKWRWLVKDLDFSYGLFQQGGGWNTGDPTPNSLGRMFDANSNLWPNDNWSTLLFRKLMENEGWRNDFVNRMADQMNVYFDQTRMNNRIDEFEQIYQTEIQAHADRWSSGYTAFNAHVDKIRIYADGRRAVMNGDMVSEISDVTGTTNVTVNASPANAGIVRISTINLDDTNFPWSGTYFRGVEIPFEAIPAPGYVFSHWTGNLSGSDASTETVINGGSASVTAHFVQGSSSTAQIVINEINYNSPDLLESGDWVEFFNPNNSSVDISGWYFQDSGGSYFPIPANTSIPAGGYLVLVEEEALFNNVYPGIPHIGAFGEGPLHFGLSGGGELITLKNANGVLIDEVDYDDNAPWPTEADGDGPTLQLISPNLNNALASSWEAIPSTPNAENGTNTGPSNQTINFPSIADKLNTAPDFSVTATASSGLPVTLIITSGPATISGNTISLTGGVGIVTVVASQNGNAQYNPAPNVTRTFNVTDGSGPGNYCTSTGTAPWEQWISNVSIGNINNDSAKELYGDFTSQSTNVNTGSNYDIDLSAGFSYFGSDMYFSVWIDYNADGDFADAGETALQQILSNPGNGVGSASISGTISIPSNAANSPTRMRISAQKDAYSSPCETFANGEVEDYTLIIGGGNTATLSINCPNSVTITAAPGATSATATWNAASASSTCTTGSVSVNQTGGQSSGSSFNIGTHTIEYTATDGCGNTEICSFTVTVLSSNASLSINCPSNVTVTAAPGATSATATWNTASATSTCTTGSVSVNQTGGLSSGSSFNIGTHTIEYTATDGCGNTEVCSFTVTVLSSNASLSINCPSNVTVTAAPGATSATATWNAASANSTCTTGSVSVNQTGGQSSGSSFNIGTYTIEYSATDGCGNTEVCSFTVTILEDNTGGTYCDASADQPWQQWLNNVTLGSINNDTGKNQYSDYTNLSTDVSNGDAISLSAAYSYFGFDAYWRVWIDYNQDNIFQTSEVVFENHTLAPANGIGSDITTGTLSIPANALTGNTRMRVALRRDAFADPCGTFTYGEIEDYTVNVMGGGNNGTLTINCPSNVTVTAAPGATSASVSWNAATANSTCTTGSVSVNQTGGQTSGSNFNIGTYFIEYTATDGCNNIEVCSFVVTVLSSNATLTLNCPPDVIEVAPVGSTNGIIIWSDATANSTCTMGSVSVVQTGGQLSGANFILGTYTIEYTATDGCGNTEVCTFNVSLIEGQTGGCTVNYTTTNNSITVTGLNGTGHVIAKIFSPSWATLYNCLDNCDDPLVMSNLTAGTYHLSYNLYTSDWVPICSDLIDIPITGGVPSIASDVEFLYFFAEKTGLSAQINWTSNTGFKNDFFELERSQNGIDFKTITHVTNTIDGQAPSYFNFIDYDPERGNNYYRLKQVHFDGTFIYSNVKNLLFDIDLDQISIYPNPTNYELFVDLSEFKGQQLHLASYNQLGQKTSTLELEELNSDPVRLDVSNLNPGMHMLSIQIGNLKVITKKFIVIK